MAELENEISIECPYCGTQFQILVDLTGGKHQTFTTDCETCCRPIDVTAEIDENGEISFEVSRE